MKIKVCGMRDAENIAALTVLKPDFMGFIFYKKSPRYVGDHYCMPVIPNEIIKTGVFVNEPLAVVLSTAKKYQLQAVQIHGIEDMPYYSSLKKANLTVLKAVAIDDSFEFSTLKPYLGIVDYFLFDTKTSEYGGSGRIFNWKMLEKYQETTPFFVAGGLSNDNIQELMLLKHPLFTGIDVNSKFEIKPALKDIEALKKLFLRLKTTA